MEKEIGRYFVAIMPPAELRRRLTAISERYNLPPWIGSAGPHITLVPPFDTKAATDDVVLCLGAAVYRKPFTVILDGWGRFDNFEGRSIAFGRVVPSLPLAHLADAALASIQHLGARMTEKFIPHFSIAAASPKEEVDRFMTLLEKERLNASFICTRFHLLQRQHNPKLWVPVRELSLIG